MSAKNLQNISIISRAKSSLLIHSNLGSMKPSVPYFLDYSLLGCANGHLYHGC